MVWRFAMDLSSVKYIFTDTLYKIRLGKLPLPSLMLFKHAKFQLSSAAESGDELMTISEWVSQVLHKVYYWKQPRLPVIQGPWSRPYFTEHTHNRFVHSTFSAFGLGSTFIFSSLRLAKAMFLEISQTRVSTLPTLPSTSPPSIEALQQHYNKDSHYYKGV